MSVLVTTFIIIALYELVRWIEDLINWGNETLPTPDLGSILDSAYKPEECDIKMSVDCQKLLDTYFREPMGEPLYVRIENRMKGMTPDQKKKLIMEITAKASTVMHVQLDNVVFENSDCMGTYNFRKNELMVSNAYIESDKCNVEVIKTIFHELKHAVQYKAVSTGGNVWGYSDDTLIAWANNFQDYISCVWDPEGYYTQPIEIDSFGFECSVIPLPGLGLPSNNTNV